MTVNKHATHGRASSATIFYNPKRCRNCDVRPQKHMFLTCRARLSTAHTSQNTCCCQYVLPIWPYVKSNGTSWKQKKNTFSCDFTLHFCPSVFLSVYLFVCLSLSLFSLRITEKKNFDFYFIWCHVLSLCLVTLLRVVIKINRSSMLLKKRIIIYLAM